MERNAVEEANPLPIPLVRMLKIEEEGDFARGKIKPKIRIIGHWLERAGFIPGHRVHVTCVAPGVIELRFLNIEATQPVSENPF